MPFYATINPRYGSGTLSTQKSEIVQVRAVDAATNTWTVVRGQQRTTAENWRATDQIGVLPFSGEVWNTGDQITATGITGVAGVSSTFGLTLDAAGSQTLQYSFGTTSMGSQTFSVSPGKASSLTAASTTSTATHGSTYSVTLTMTDAFGNPISGTFPVTASGDTGVGDTLDGVTFTSGSATDPSVTFGSIGQAAVTLVFSTSGTRTSPSRWTVFRVHFQR